MTNETLEQKTEGHREPTFPEVAGRMKKQAKETFSSVVHNTSNSSPYKFVRNFSMTFAGMTLAPYMLPSALNNPDSIVRKEFNRVVDTFGGLAGYTLGFIAGVGADVIQIATLAGFVSQDRYEPLSIFLTTNCVSGIYEWYRNTKQQMIKESKKQKAQHETS